MDEPVVRIADASQAGGQPRAYGAPFVAVVRAECSHQKERQQARINWE